MFPAEINAADLDGNNGFIVDGLAQNNKLGQSVSNAGDINGDGVDDILLGEEPFSNPGKSYIIFGNKDEEIAASGNFNLSSFDGNNGFSIQGERSGDDFGISVSNAGDFNNDGFDDIIVGASASPNGTTPLGLRRGAAYIIYGGSNVGDDGNLFINTLSTNSRLIIRGITNNDRLGNSVSNAGDINGDNIDDIIVGASIADINGNLSGSAYIVFGGSNVGNNGGFDLNSLDGSNGFSINGLGQNDNLGRSVSNAGDINNDGVDDLIVSSRSGNHVIFGGTDIGNELNIDHVFDLNNLDGSNGFTITATGSVSNAGDVNGDNIDDLILGTSRKDQAYVVFGDSDIGDTGTFTLSSSNLDGTGGFIINGVTDDDSGFSVSNAGDINADGVGDLIIGARQALNNGGAKAGSAYIVFGDSDLGSSGTLDVSSLDGNNGFVVEGINASDFTGSSVSNAGDVNDDGADDLVIGAIQATPNGTSSGQSYIVYGINPNPDPDPDPDPTVITGTPQNDTLTGTSGDDSIRGLAGDDFILGLNGNDIIEANKGQDSLRGGNGDDTLRGQDGNDFLFGQIGNDLLIGGNDNDTLRGGLGNDSIKGSNGNDRLFGGEGQDSLRGEGNNDVIFGEEEEDLLIGGGGTDKLNGGNGNDTLSGDNGNDFLYGGNGNDIIRPGSGRDRIELTRGVDIGLDRIIGYQDGLDKFFFSNRFGLGDLDFNDLNITQSGQNTRIRIADNNQSIAIVVGIDSNMITEADFI